MPGRAEPPHSSKLMNSLGLIIRPRQPVAPRQSVAHRTRGIGTINRLRPHFCFRSRTTYSRIFGLDLDLPPIGPRESN